ncbi:SDR family NAD(P)-dependent oxidoreductase [Limobrevibacterium gyesilva]|uniref:SDR family oxidoreductase n=1 Tax=Limobrevibacterium gyesilva TaxID=2991712 RepID=A0AA41YL53_9PROT|nr:SDR family oxidoreductase [Limobrevibacterium gyesilva]MCW3474645.1 SDR family oxidoreductase [Limobrevibacterium gyesilva]
MEIDLSGRAAVITGGSRGLGLAMATRFAASGADVAILARRPDALEEARKAIAAVAKGKVLAVPCDVSKADEIARAHDAVMSGLGRIDIVVNNAGTSRTGAFEDVTDAIWQEDLDLKLFAAIRLARLAWPHMRERRWGRVINVLNIGAKAPRAGGCPTVVSRAAGMALTKVLAGEGAPHGILVNALLVGLIVTEQVKTWHRLRGGNMSLKDFIAKTGEAVPLGRMGTAEEFANMACFLASDLAGYVTGTAINVDGGSSPVV